MKIASVAIHELHLTSHVPYYMADGKACETVKSILLQVRTDAGLTGWGECCPIPHYLPAYADGVAPVVRELRSVLIGADPCRPEAVLAACDRFLSGHLYVKSAIDIALWDLFGQAAGQPIHALLGGQRADDLPLYHSITCVAPDEMARMAREAQATGITQFQVKLGADQSWEADAARLRAVREAVGPGPLVYGDWNCGATQLHATRVGRAVAELDVMLEQPCATLEQCAAVRAATSLPMKIDECAFDHETLLRANALGCLDAVALKLSKFGGISALRRARDLCLHLGPQMCVEDTWGSDIATVAALHVAATVDPQRLLNTCDLSGYSSPRLCPDAPTRKDGRIAVPQGIGLGVTPDPELIGDPIDVIG